MSTPVFTHNRAVVLVATMMIVTLAACGSFGLSEKATTTPTEVPPTATKTPIPRPSATPTPESHAITVEKVEGLKDLRTIVTNDVGSWVSAVAFSPTSREVASFGFDKMVRIWDADTGEMLRRMGPHGNWGLGLAYSPDGKLLAAGGGGADIIVWDPSSGQKRSTGASNSTRVYSLDWSLDGEEFAIAGERSSRLAVFSNSGSLKQEVSTGSGMLWSVAYSEDYLAAGASTQKVHVYDAKTYSNVTELSPPGVTAALDFSLDGSLLAGCHRDGSIVIWDTSDWSAVKSWMAHPKKGCAMGCKTGAFSLNGDLYFSGGDEGALNVWDSKTGELLKTFNFSVMVWSISLSSDGEMLAAGLDNGELHILGLP